MFRRKSGRRPGSGAHCLAGDVGIHYTLSCSRRSVLGASEFLGAWAQWLAAAARFIGTNLAKIHLRDAHYHSAFRPPMNLHHLIRPAASSFFGLILLAAASSSASSFTIGENLTVAEAGIQPNVVVDVTLSLYPSGSYAGGAYAGINQLRINGSEIVNGFCIDPFHYSSGSALGYTVASVADAPKGDLNPLSPDPAGSGTGMGTGSALLVETLWGSHYDPHMSANDAATLQLAIWDVVGGSTFSTTSGLNTTALQWIAAANQGGPRASLVALTGPGQDYIVESVPDAGSTLLLLGLAVALLFPGRCRMFVAAA